MSRTVPVCYNCGKPGHQEKTCPTPDLDDDWRGREWEALLEIARLLEEKVVRVRWASLLVHALRKAQGHSDSAEREQLKRMIDGLQ